MRNLTLIAVVLLSSVCLLLTACPSSTPKNPKDLEPRIEQKTPPVQESSTKGETAVTSRVEEESALSPAPSQRASAVRYEIAQTEDVSYASVERKVYRVVVSPQIRENQVRPTVEAILNQVRQENPDTDEIGLFLYSDRDAIGGAYDVARADWAPGGKWGSTTPEIARSNDRTGYSISLVIQPDLEAYLAERSRSEVKDGLTEAQRRSIYKEIVAAADRAMAEAERLYPDPDDVFRQIDACHELEERYKAEVRDKWGITEEVQTRIVIEGVAMHWSRH